MQRHSLPCRNQGQSVQVNWTMLQVDRELTGSPLLRRTVLALERIPLSSACVALFADTKYAFR